MTDLHRINSYLSKLYRRALSVLASQVNLQLLPLLDCLHVPQPAIHLQVQVLMQGLVILVLVWGSVDRHGKWALVQRKLDYGSLNFMKCVLWMVLYDIICSRRGERQAYVLNTQNCISRTVYIIDSF